MDNRSGEIVLGEIVWVQDVIYEKILGETTRQFFSNVGIAKISDLKYGVEHERNGLKRTPFHCHDL